MALRYDLLEPAADTDKSSFSRHEPPRARRFAVVFTLVFAAGCVYTFMQDTTWRSTATVMMGAPGVLGEAGETTGPSSTWTVETLSRRLLGWEVMAALSERLFEEHGINLSMAALGGMLRVAPVADTNLIELSAEGSVRSDLPLVVGGWIDAYTRVRADEAAGRREEIAQVVDREPTALEVRLQAARDALDAYRREHDIPSSRPEDNAVPAQLDAVEQAFDEAIAEEVRTAANLEKLKLQARRGERIVPEDREREVKKLESELKRLQSEMVEVESRFTQRYIERNLQLRGKVERIAELQRELERVYADGREAELAEAREAHAAAQQALREARDALSRLRERVADVSGIYRTRDALAEEVARLEALVRDAPLAEVEVAGPEPERYPELVVLEPPPEISDRIGPDYAVLLGGSAGLAFLLGLLGAWFPAGPVGRSPESASLSARGVPPERPAVPPARPMEKEPLGHEERMEMARMLTRREPRSGRDKEDEADR